MRLAPAITPASPALAFARDHAFLTEGEHPAVQKLVPVDPTTVEVLVGDSWAEPGDADPEADHVYADTAASVLEQSVDGVRLIVKTQDGYVGREGYFSGDEQYFANSLPGLTSQAAEVEWDVDGDGIVGDDEAAFLFPVATQADADRLDPIVRDTISDYPVRFSVEG
jgi:hypothetical protein